MTSWPDARIAMIDVETTGKDPDVDRVVELAVVIGEKREIVARKSWLLDPERDIPEEVTKIHGIGNDDVRGKPKFGEIAIEFAEMCAGACLAAYNEPFDRAFIKEEFQGWERAADAWLDPLVWAKEAQKYERSKKLGAVAERLGIPVIGTAHRATADAETALHVLYALRKPSAWADWGRRQNITDPTGLRVELGKFFPADLEACLWAQEKLRVAQEEDFKAWLAKQPAERQARGT